MQNCTMHVAMGASMFNDKAGVGFTYIPPSPAGVLLYVPIITKMGTSLCMTGTDSHG